MYLIDESSIDLLAIDGLPVQQQTEPADSIWYDYFGLQNESIITETAVDNPANLVLSERGYPRADGEFVETAYFRRKVITVSGHVTAATPELLELYMDQMKQALVTRGATLMLSHGGIKRYFDGAYCTGIDKLFSARQSYHVNYAPFTFDVICPDPFARSQYIIAFSPPTAITASETTYEVTNLGSAYSRPVFNFAAIVGGTASGFKLENLTTLETIEVTHSFSNGDTLSIDSELKSVLVNGAETDWSGIIPSLKQGKNSIKVTLSGSGFIVSMSEHHYTRYV